MSCDWCGTPYTYLEFCLNPIVLCLTGLVVLVVSWFIMPYDVGVCYYKTILYYPFCFFPIISLMIVLLGVVRLFFYCKGGKK